MTAPHSLYHGDFAYGQRTRPDHFQIRGNFATGMHITSPPTALGDFATGMRTSSISPATGDFATGMRAAPIAAIPRLHYSSERSPVVITV
ncbi:MAG TPA: hypothetical protein VEF89_15195 [Solirubrobacteraceae bacterium]|nr:hypothetical protein [Solirubrobacteraceae bacterium]